MRMREELEARIKGFGQQIEQTDRRIEEIDREMRSLVSKRSTLQGGLDQLKWMLSRISVNGASPKKSLAPFLAEFPKAESSKQSLADYLKGKADDRDKIRAIVGAFAKRGLTTREIIEEAAKRELPLKLNSTSAYLSKCVQTGIMKRSDHRYYPATIAFDPMYSGSMGAPSEERPSPSHLSLATE